MTNAQEPTKQQVDAANAAEHAKWEDDFKKEELIIPFSREDKKETKDEEIEKDVEKQEQENTDTEDAIYSEPEPIIKTKDPGEFKPSDYSFTVETLDGTKTEITTPDQAEEFINANADNLSVAQQMSLMRKTTAMETKLSKDLEKYQSVKEKYDTEIKLDNERKENIQSLSNEIQYMITKGLLPAVDAQYKNADWSDPTIAKQPGVKEQIELVNYMTKENSERAKMGVKPFASMIDAYNDMVREKVKSQENESKQRSDKARKDVASTSSAPSASSTGIQAPKGISVGNPNVFRRNSSIWE